MECINEIENEVFKVEKFKSMGKENDYNFQVLCFLGNSIQKMSLAFTLLKNINVPKEIESEFLEILEKQQELKEKIRKLK